MKRSRYLVVNTRANKIWLFPDIPEREKQSLNIYLSSPLIHRYQLGEVLFQIKATPVDFFSI